MEANIYIIVNLVLPIVYVPSVKSVPTIITNAKVVTRKYAESVSNNVTSVE